MTNWLAPHFQAHLDRYREGREAAENAEDFISAKRFIMLEDAAKRLMDGLNGTPAPKLLTGPKWRQAATRVEELEAAE